MSSLVKGHAASDIIVFKLHCRRVHVDEGSTDASPIFTKECLVDGTTFLLFVVDSAEAARADFCVLPVADLPESSKKRINMDLDPISKDGKDPLQWRLCL